MIETYVSKKKRVIYFSVSLVRSDGTFLSAVIWQSGEKPSFSFESRENNRG